MAATPGNQWWRLRSKHGRDAIFTTPALLETECEAYFTATDERTDWDGQNWVGKDGEEVVVKKRVPYTLSGLCMYLGVAKQYFNDFEKTDTFKENKDFSLVYARVRNTIETQQVEGALNRYYPDSLVARLNGFVDRTDVTSGDEPLKAQIIVQDKQAATDLDNLGK